MKEEMKKQLIKDIVIAVIAWIVVSVVFIATSPSMGVGGNIFLGFFCAGIPFGWRWMSKVFTAISLYTVIVKAILSIVLGWIALPVILIKDIVLFVKAE